MAGLWTRPVLLIMCRRHDILTCNSQLTRPGPDMPLNYFFAFPAQQITLTLWDSTQQWNGTRRGIKNNKEMAKNCAPQPNLIRQQPTDWGVKAVYFDDCQFLPSTAQSWEHQSIFMIDFGVLFWLEECGPCVKCFYPRPEGLRSRDCDGISELTRIQLIL